MRAYERLLKYVKIYTESSPDTGATPSTPGQWDLARLLAEELKELGLENPSVNEHCIVTAWLPRRFPAQLVKIRAPGLQLQQGDALSVGRLGEDGQGRPAPAARPRPLWACWPIWTPPPLSPAGT